MSPRAHPAPVADRGRGVVCYTNSTVRLTDFYLQIINAPHSVIQLEPITPLVGGKFYESLVGLTFPARELLVTNVVQISAVFQ